MYIVQKSRAISYGGWPMPAKARLHMGCVSWARHADLGHVVTKKSEKSNSVHVDVHGQRVRLLRKLANIDIDVRVYFSLAHWVSTSTLPSTVCTSTSHSSVRISRIPSAVLVVAPTVGYTRAFPARQGDASVSAITSAPLSTICTYVLLSNVCISTSTVCTSLLPFTV